MTGVTPGIDAAIALRSPCCAALTAAALAAISLPLMSVGLSLRFTLPRSRHGAHRIEQHHALKARIGDEDVLIGGALDLEPLGREADGGDVDEVVALAAGKGDGEAPALVGARGAVDSASYGRRGDVRVLDGGVVGARDDATDDVDLLGCGLTRRRHDGEERGHYNR